MTTKAKPKPKSRLLGAVHETANDLGRLSFIDKRAQQKLDVLCLEPIPAHRQCANGRSAKSIPAARP